MGLLWKEHITTAKYSRQVESSITLIQETPTAAICAPQLGLSSSGCSVQLVQVHQGRILNNLLGDKEQKNLHPEWNGDPTEDQTELITVFEINICVFTLSTQEKMKPRDVNLFNQITIALTVSNCGFCFVSFWMIILTLQSCKTNEFWEAAGK